jgi:hypothetical protein
MILGLSVVLVVLIVASWVTAMYVSWKRSEGLNPSPIKQEVFVSYWSKMVRKARRTYYRSLFTFKQSLTWGNKQFGHVFFSLFPSAEPAFAKRDMLAGLKDGPTSYFLMSISQEEPRKTRRTRKIV